MQNFKISFAFGRFWSNGSLPVEFKIRMRTGNRRAGFNETGGVDASERCWNKVDWLNSTLYLRIEQIVISTVFCVLSFHVGSGCRDPSAYAIGIAYARQLFDIGESLGFRMRILDLGGGFPGKVSSLLLFKKRNWFFYVSNF